jgi:hypothetical protein
VGNRWRSTALLAVVIAGSGWVADRVHDRAAAADVPPAGADASGDRLLPAPPPPDLDDGYVFLARQRDGAPVTFDPCRTIRIVVNERTAPAGARALLDQAVATVSEATGLRLLVAGTTDEVPSLDRPLYQPDRYGERWAPILVAWTDVAETPDLEGAAGRAGPRATVVPGTEELAYVSGVVVLDGPGLTGHEPITVYGVILHELGHLVGLDHVEDPGQLMFDSWIPSIQVFEDGDLAGLAHLGRGPCRPTL